MNKLTWQDVLERDRICLYPGDIYPRPVSMDHFVGLSITKEDHQHILHDARKPLPLPDNSVDLYFSEDVFEHIPYLELEAVIDEIYRVLKPGGIFRLAMPDYRCDVLRDRSEIVDGRIVFDPGGGGTRENPGHVWFPVYETVEALLFGQWWSGIRMLQGYNYLGEPVLKDIDPYYGYVQRTPDNDPRVQNPRRPMSMVWDCMK